MYGIFRTITPSQSIHSLIFSQFNQRDLIVCQRNTCLDFYTLSSDNIPQLYKSFRGNCTFLKTFTYKPPTDSSTSLLILTVKYELLALKLIDGKFETKLLVNLQENGHEKIETDPMLLVDPSYNLILFYGYSRLLKCILLDKEDYFDFKNVVNLRMNQDHIVDLFFTNNKYNSITYTNKLRQSKTFNDNCILTINGFSDARDFLRPKRIDRSKPINMDNDILLLQVGLILLLQPESDSSNRHIEILRLYFEIFNGEDDKTNKSYILGYGYERIADTLVIDQSVSNILPFPPESDTLGILFVGSSVIGYKHLDDKIDLCYVYNGHLVAEIDCICYKGIQRSLSRVTGDETHIYYASDITGQLYMFKITIKHEKDKYLINDRMRNLDTIIPLYTITPFSFLLSLNNDYIFVATRVGDSKILHLENGKIIEIWNKPSLSPIVDATVIQGTCTDKLVAVSGMGKSSNISILTIGLFFHNICTINISMVTRLFVASKGPKMAYIVAATHSNSYFLKMVDKSVDLIERSSRLIYAFKYNDKLYQLTSNSLVLSTFDNPCETITLWTYNQSIVHYLNFDNILITSSGYDLNALVIDQNDVKVNYRQIIKLTTPISAITLAYYNTSKPLVLVATFTNVLFLVDYESKTTINICKVTSNPSVGISDLAFIVKANDEKATNVKATNVKTSIAYIFVGLTDGSVVVYTNKAGSLDQLVDPTRWQPFIYKGFGTHPIHFKKNSQHLSLIGQYVHIVKFSDKTGRITDFLPIEISRITDMDFIFDDLIIISLSNHMELGTISDVNSLAVKRISVNGTMDLIEYHKQSNCIFVAFPSSTLDSIIPSKAYISVYNMFGSFVTKYYLEDGYESCCISQFTKGNDNVLLIGTCGIETHYMPNRGKIIACIYDNGAFTFKDSYKFEGDLSAQPNGGVLQICTNKSNIFVGVNNSLVILTPITIGRSWQGELSPIYTYNKCNMIIGIDVYDDLVLLTDIISGVQLLRFNNDNNSVKLDEIAKDIESNWCNCAKLIDQNHIIVSDIKGNVTLLKVIDDPINDEQCLLLTKIAKFHLGECVNKITMGKFACYAMSATGAIYEFKFVDLKTFAPLHIFEQSMLKVLNKSNNNHNNHLPDYGDHMEFRKVDKLCNVVDGDLLGLLFELEDDLLAEIAEKASDLGLKFNYSFNISHLLKWKCLKYDEFLVDFDNSILSL